MSLVQFRPPESGSPLTSKLGEMIAAVEEDARKAEQALESLKSERDAEVARIRESYAEREATLKADLATVNRVRNALIPPERKPRESKPASRQYPHPKEETLDRIRAAMLRLGAGKKVTAAQVAVEAGMDKTAAYPALNYMRHTGEVVLAGKIKASPKAHVKAAAWRLITSEEPNAA